MLSELELWLRACQVPPPVARWLPGSSRVFGPPRRVGRIRDVVPAAGGTVQEAEPGGVLPDPQPVVHGERSTFLDNFRRESPPTCVFTLPKARLLTADGFVVTADDCFLRDAAFVDVTGERVPPGHRLFRRKRARPIHPLRGTCVSLATDFAAGSFGHFLHDGYARLHLLTRTAVDLRQVDWIFCPHPPGRAAERLFQLLPVPRERIITLDHAPGHDYEADHLIGTSFPGIAGNITPGTARFLQEIGGQWRQSSRPRERVFLGRDGWRRNLANPEPAYALLREFGFRILDPVRESDVLEACAGAEIVAGVDGSNMANLAFAPRDCRILLIFPSECPPVPYNSTLATSGGRPLHVIQGDPLPGQPHLYDAPFDLALNRLRRCLEQVCAGSSP